jgi:type II secretory pathway component GspD/PulD (secretin)
VQSGTFVDTVAGASGDGKRVALEFSAKVQNLMALNDWVLPGSPKERELKVQVPTMSTTAVKTTLDVGSGELVVLGGTTVEGEGAKRMLVVLVRATTKG